MYYFLSMTEGYSASDLKFLASDASLGPIRGKGVCVIAMLVPKLRFWKMCWDHNLEIIDVVDGLQ